MTGVEMLRAYCRAKGLAVDEMTVEIGAYGDSPEMADKLLRLILNGKKRATCWACLGEEPPGSRRNQRRDRLGGKGRLHPPDRPGAGYAL